jgi:hypothetical protein
VLGYIYSCKLCGEVGVYQEHGSIALAWVERLAIANALGKVSSAAILQSHGDADFHLFCMRVLRVRQLWARFDRSITIAQTVDEAAFLFYSLEKASQSQLLAEAAAANKVHKKVIFQEMARFTGDSVQSSISEVALVWHLTSIAPSKTFIGSLSQSLISLSQSLMVKCSSKIREPC